MRCYRPCWIGRLRESCEKRPIPRPLPKWEGVPATEGRSAARGAVCEQQCVEGQTMAKIQHPWQVGPTELIEFALERMHQGSDFDRRLAFLVLDLGVETLFKTFLKLPESVTQFQTKRGERLEASEGNFHELLRGVQNANSKKASKFFFAHIEHYHNIRNLLYHQGNQAMAVPMNQLEGYAKLAVDLLKTYLEVDLSKKLKRPAAMAGEITVDNIRAMLKGRPLRPNHLALFRILDKSGSEGIEGRKLAEAMKLTYPQLTGVLGALGVRINSTQGLEDKGGISVILDIKEINDGEWSYIMRPILQQALKEEGLI